MIKEDIIIWASNLSSRQQTKSGSSLLTADHNRYRLIKTRRQTKSSSLLLTANYSRYQLVEPISGPICRYPRLPSNGPETFTHFELETENGTKIESLNAKIETLVALNRKMQVENDELTKLKAKHEEQIVSLKKNENYKKDLQEQQEIIRKKQSYLKRPHRGANDLAPVNFVDRKEFTSCQDADGREILLGSGTFGICKLKTFARTGGKVVCKEIREPYNNKKALVKEAQFCKNLPTNLFPLLVYS